MHPTKPQVVRIWGRTDQNMGLVYYFNYYKVSISFIILLLVVSISWV